MKTPAENEVAAKDDVSISDGNATKGKDSSKKKKYVKPLAIDKKRKLMSPKTEVRSAKIAKVDEGNDCQESVNVSLIESDGESVSRVESAKSPKIKTPGKASKSRKSECKENALTRFLKPIDNKGNKDLKEDQNGKEKSIDDPDVEICKNEDNDSDKSKMETDNSDTSEIIVDDQRKGLSESSITDESDKKNSSATAVHSDMADSSDSADESLKSDLDEKLNVSHSNTSTPTTKRILNPDSQRKLTPKQLEKKLANQRKREEREKIRLEKERKMQEEKDNRRKEKEEKKKEKEEKDKALREQKKKEKELKDLKKQHEIEQRQKEKEAKEEDRRKREEAKEEEKRRKEEEKLEAERKKQKAASNFVSFFVPKKPNELKSTDHKVDEEMNNFMPFQVKNDMRIAPLTRRPFDESDKIRFDKLNKSNLKKSDLYISELKSGKIEARCSGKTWPIEAKDDDIIILEDDDDQTSDVVQSINVIQKHRPKLLLFKENRRPPFWGTWRKKSSCINPRRPFSKDTKWFDYEVDSDEEWEEEDPDGESIRGSDDEKAQENPDDNEYDVDNEFMVPHGYLSEEEEEARADEDDRDSITPESQQFKLKLLGAEFEAEQNTKTTKLKPKVMGLIWMHQDSTHSQNLSSYTTKYLKMRECWVYGIPVDLNVVADTDAMNLTECKTPSSKHGSAGPGTRKTTVPEEAMPDFIRLLHGNTHGKGFLVKEFVTFWNKHKKGEQISKVSLLKKMREISNWMACPDEGPLHLRNCWYVSENYRKQYLPSEELPIPNLWSYLLTPKKQNDTHDKVEKESKDKIEIENKDNKEKKYVALITQFTKKITQEEMKKQLVEKSEGSKVNTPEAKLRKPEESMKSPRVSLLNKFFIKDSPSNGNKVTKTNKNDSDDDVIVIDDSSQDN